MSEFCRRKLEFSGRRWLVKGTDTREGPGPNYFSDDEENVWVDGEGRLHLRISERDGQWRCAEVVSEEEFGYGHYVFKLGGGADAINENVVLGLFTWDTDPEYHNREIDIEIARWAEAANENCQYVVQPYEHPGKLHRFGVDLAGACSTHSFEWQRGRVAFRSARGGGNRLMDLRRRGHASAGARARSHQPVALPWRASVGLPRGGGGRDPVWIHAVSRGRTRVG